MPSITSHWNCKPFDLLTARELYAVLQLRNEVFVVEQNCVFQDADNKDFFCYHLMCWQDTNLIAYTRIVPPGISYVESSIGRVVTSPKHRNTGIGKWLMRKTIDLTFALYNAAPIRIGAQRYLQPFYESFGFTSCSDVYLEDDIEHIEMILSR